MNRCVGSNASESQFPVSHIIFHDCVGDYFIIIILNHFIIASVIGVNQYPPLYF